MLGAKSVVGLRQESEHVTSTLVTYQIFPSFSNVKVTKVKQNERNDKRPRAQADPLSSAGEQTMQRVGQGHIIKAVSVMI